MSPSLLLLAALTVGCDAVVAETEDSGGGSDRDETGSAEDSGSETDVDTAMLCSDSPSWTSVHTVVQAVPRTRTHKLDTDTQDTDTSAGTATPSWTVPDRVGEHNLVLTVSGQAWIVADEAWVSVPPS